VPPAKKKKYSRGKRGSLLESILPLEVVELIFYHSENLNFPRSNPRLGLFLSGRSTLVKTLITAFSLTWEI